MLLVSFILYLSLWTGQCWCQLSQQSRRDLPDNIILVLTQDVDQELHTMDAMGSLRSKLIWKGIDFTNHFTPSSHGGASRASIFRGQHAHNTNMTHPTSPGGGYAKWLASGLSDDYLPIWLRNAGYQTEFIGKFMDGYDKAIFDTPPSGWDMVDALVEPWGSTYNRPVFSQDGRAPIYYRNRHQTDVIRAKAMERLKVLFAQEKPFFLMISTHAIQGSVDKDWRPQTCSRHSRHWRRSEAPQTPNYNPTDSLTLQKSSWVSRLPSLGSRDRWRTDSHHVRRLQTLESVDQMVHQIYRYVRSMRALSYTWIVFTSDSGYHLGNHRVRAGKMLPYIEDVRVPLAVRGPVGPEMLITRRTVNDVPSTHLDLAPTFLEIARVPRVKWPKYFDGRSMLSVWKNPWTLPKRNDLRRIMLGEFWGRPVEEAGRQKHKYTIEPVAYKSLRVLGEDDSWLYIRWCSGEAELYNTHTDPDELYNLVLQMRPRDPLDRIRWRLDALLLVAKSCSGDNCRNPWTELQRECRKTTLCPSSIKMFRSFESSMNSMFDGFFESLPKVTFARCLESQHVDNEEPYLPPKPELGMEFRKSPHHFTVPVRGRGRRLMATSERVGGWANWKEPLSKMNEEALQVTAKQLGRRRPGWVWPPVVRHPTNKSRQHETKPPIAPIAPFFDYEEAEEEWKENEKLRKEAEKDKS
ncbi:hypothetical protein CDD82_5014 [Ophiocordyceps australis]|uniref:Sulfatase N-terminal domain-containing protein n=1 Tax=Ophiocordyceps australis TaxID=1399860 RepID=A0A2C5Z545_9HYPO|nr:hypothetical protein CDD82_5014 [Ophiocordyceps australis]